MDIWIQNYIFHIPYNPFCIYGPHKDFYEYISYALFSIVIKLTYKKYSNESHAAILHVQNNYLSKFSTYFPRLCYHTLLQHHIIRFATLIQGSSSSQDPRVVITGCRDSCRKNMQIGGVFRKLKWQEKHTRTHSSKLATEGIICLKTKVVRDVTQPPSSGSSSPSAVQKIRLQQAYHRALFM